MRCSRLYGEVGGRYLATKFDGARVHETNLFPKGHTGSLTSAVYSPAGDKILSASWDKTVKEWDAATGECLRTLTGYTDGVSSALYSPTGDKIVTASFDHTVKEWDTITGKCLQTHRKEDNSDLSEYHYKNTLNEELHINGNKIFLHPYTLSKNKRTLVNIPGLWIQGCSFKNLEKNSQLDEEARKLMKQYGARF